MSTPITDTQTIVQQMPTRPNTTYNDYLAANPGRNSGWTSIPWLGRLLADDSGYAAWKSAQDNAYSDAIDKYNLQLSTAQTQKALLEDAGYNPSYNNSSPLVQSQGEIHDQGVPQIQQVGADIVGTLMNPMNLLNLIGKSQQLEYNDLINTKLAKESDYWGPNAAYRSDALEASTLERMYEVFGPSGMYPKEKGRYRSSAFTGTSGHTYGRVGEDSSVSLLRALQVGQKAIQDGTETLQKLNRYQLNYTRKYILPETLKSLQTGNDILTIQKQLLGKFGGAQAVVSMGTQALNSITNLAGAIHALIPGAESQEIVDFITNPNGWTKTTTKNR